MSDTPVCTNGFLAGRWCVWGRVVTLNALMDVGIDPRIAFWKRPYYWPDDAPDQIFAGRAILELGRVAYGNKWSDDLPMTDLVWELPEQLTLYTPLEEIRRGCEALRVCSNSYRERVVESAATLMSSWSDDFPTKAEWREAVAHVRQQSISSWDRFVLFITVARELSEACKAGRIQSFLRPAQGGQPIEKPWYFWNVERSWSRFETCRVDPNHEYTLSPTPATGHWLFLDRPAFDGFCRDRAKPAERPAEVAPEVERIRRSKPRGRPRGDQIDMLAGYYARLLAAGEFTDETSTREVARRIFEFAAETCENPHDEEYIRERVAIWRQKPNRPSEE